ncbi:winged helix-turn-helix domain-containing protein [Nonomuraea sp. SMC257]|uniref:Winged helix-turn-helix domain-containing protein n=1 Tax=Nonomuraea montanisoli TaxID=2741721 RepID=A0A7Y6IGG4_9ACTN|nr:winged helix-turn-helix domain-containing protein [Nonomuraea montanisoli]
MRVGILGPLTLDTATGPAWVGGARLRALLARLALDAGRAVRPATLVEALWGEADPAGHLHALQSLASRLRRVLGDPGLLASGSAGYRLAVEPEAVDAARFERLARAGRRALALSRPAEAAATLREALSLWRGPALADVREAPFAAADAERLERARLAALEDRVEAELALGHDLDLVAELESLTAAYPLRERLHAQLVRALALNGRGAEALAAYERIRGLLADTFGADPGPQLQEAHLAVLRGELREHPRPRRTHGNLDVPLTSFVGRDDDVRRVTGLLGRVRLVTLVGPAGAGKTRLAGTVGRRLAPSGGVWFVPLAPAGADDVPRVVLDLLRAREQGVPPRPVPPEAVLDHLADTLADGELVLVLDNCEHVVEAAATLAATLLGRCPRLRVLATSREPLRIDGETLHPVLPLELPEPGATAERARACAAVRLFHDRAAAVRPDFALEGGALAAAVEICRRLDGLPLAIELAAARLRALPAEAVAARLDDRFRLLTGGSRTALPRHRTLDAAVAWSWDLLDGDERLLLERLSVVPGDFTEDTAAAIGRWDGFTEHAAAVGGRGGSIKDAAVGGRRDVRDLLAALADKSLLHPVEPADPVEPRYRMLETIREYGLARLARRGEVDAVRARHAGFFLRLAETADPHLRTSGQLRWLARLSSERDNLSAAIRWAVESGDAALAVRFGVALCWFWFLRDHPPESLDLLGRVLQVRGPAEPRARALVLAAHALAMTEAISRPEEAEAAFDRIREALEHAAPGSHPVVEMARLALAIGAGHDPAAPAPAAPDASGAPDEPTDPVTFGSASEPTTPDAFGSEDAPAGPVVFGSLDESAVPDASGSPDASTAPWSRSLALLLQGVLAMNTGRAAEATRVLKRALTGFEELGERWGLATTLSTLHSALLRSGEPGGAPEPAERATRLFRELGMAEHTMENEVAAALRLAETGDVNGGRRRLADLLGQAGRNGSAESLVQVRLGLARLEWRAEQPGAAREHALAALAEASPGRSTPHLTALLLGVLAQADAAEGSLDEALRRLDHPAVHLTLTWHTPVAASVAVAVAAIELGRGRPERAGRLLGAATALRGWDDPGDADVRMTAQRAADVLGATGLAAARVAGAAMSRAEAEALVSATITAPGPHRPVQPT